MAEHRRPEFARFVEAERHAQRLPAATRPMAEGEVFKPVFIEAGRSTELVRVAARRAAGFFRPSKRNEVVWVEGENELAVMFTEVDVKLSTGLIRIGIPVRCDQTGPASIELLFAVGSPQQPAGLYAAAPRRPNGPDIIVSTWGDALVAFGWQCVLGLVTGIAAATGKDQRGNLLVPVEIAVTGRGIEIVPMARHRFAGSSTLKSGTKLGSRA
ncbi:hypothetical protein HZ992_18015 [Rhizobacter sp. AJA081-3]|uniref:hypothetical protein n=1 Tax=Rhizobacter sp. AJA081-3 TaxID=2753607 RepID=UPI001AE0BF6B|nr:hypothetical protein [Rhizobacter sp. AJA081-3]QTN22042.1 hypothetical protein HZ992_18015 [Rhizobacter sp. AJA081-3]